MILSNVVLLVVVVHREPDFGDDFGDKTATRDRDYEPIRSDFSP